MDQEMAGLADKIGKALVAKGCKNVAAVDFTDIQGQPTELGRFLSEQLTVEIVATSNVSMVDRANIKHILAEHNLTVEGLVDPANAKKLGEFAGVDTILVGNVTDVDDGYRLMVKGISTSSAQIIAAGWITFRKTSAIQDIANRSISSSVNSDVTPRPSSAKATTYHEDSPVATKDLGILRVVLKSAVPVGSKDQPGGVQVTFEFTNRDTRNTLVLAMNGEFQNRYSQTATPLRSRLLDDRGGVWTLLPSGLQGLGFVRVGVHGRNGADVYSTSEIGRLLQLRDDIGRSYGDPADGFYANADSCGEGGCNTTFNSGSGVTSTRKFFPYTGNTFLSGSISTIEHGQGGIVTMIFVPQAGDTNYAPKSFQFQAEIVIGTVDTDMRRSYFLHNLTFDRITMPTD
jgi:hypothetical protein